jgi:uncharacterized protein
MKTFSRRLKTPILLITGTLAVIAAGLLAYSYFIEPQKLVVSTQEVTIQGWNPAFDGMKIVMVGDVHGGSNAVDQAKLRKIVELVNDQNADLVVLLGDYVSVSFARRFTGSDAIKMPVDDVARGLAGMKAKYGVFAVLGNHDGWYNDQSVAAAIGRDGYRVLQNEVAVIDNGGHHLRLLGFKDHLKLNKPWVETSADARGWLQSTGDGDIIALQHSPDILPIITGDLSISPDLKLILAAHTHGGQVWLPIIGRPIIPSMFGQRYAYGHVRENDVDMFITSGIGTSILPFRFMVPPEIMVLTVHSG